MKRRSSGLLLLWLVFAPAMFVVELPAAAALPLSGPAAQPYQPPMADPLPDLETFGAIVQNGHPDQIVGLYLPGLAALSVLPQPAGEPYQVTNQPLAASLFSDSLAAGSIGLLAHSHLAGRYFQKLNSQQSVVLIYGDGQTEEYRVDHIESYQALEPNNPFGQFTSLHDGSLWDSQSLFTHIYASGPQLILQTCIQQDGLSNWGRLFIIATPTRELSWKGLAGVHH